MFVLLSVSLRGQCRWPTLLTLIRSPSVLQPPDDQPFTDVIAMRVGAGAVRPGNVLPESVVALPHERMVYLTLGTLFNGVSDFAVPLEALGELPVDLVLTCGYDVDPAAFEPLPRNVAVERWVSQALLLPRCSAVICHAGASTLLGALAHGVPVVCLPLGADQFANAEQVTRTGAGITLLPGQVSVESVRDATRRVLDETSYAVAACKLRSEIELLPDPSAVVAEQTRRAT
jgi:MGT family glycosyltransferase